MLRSGSVFVVLGIMETVKVAARMRYYSRIQSKNCCIFPIPLFILAVSLLLRATAVNWAGPSVPQKRAQEMLINIAAVGNRVCPQKGIDTGEGVRRIYLKITESFNKLNYRVIDFNIKQCPV